MEAFFEAMYPIRDAVAWWSHLDYDSEPELEDVNYDLWWNVDDYDEETSRHHYGMLYQPDPAGPLRGLGERPGLVASAGAPVRSITYSGTRKTAPLATR